MSPADLRASEVVNQSYIGDSDSSASDGNDIDSPNPSNQGPHVCPHPRCEQRFSSIKGTVKHINHTHKDQFPLPRSFVRCPTCLQVFTREGITYHQRRMHAHGLIAPSTPGDDANEDIPQPRPPRQEDALQISPDIDVLHQFYTLELTWIHPKWRPLLQQIHLALLQRINGRDTAVSDRSFSAYLMLPGFVEAVRIANRLPGAKQLRIEAPITYLRTFAAIEAPEHLEEVIISKMEALYSRISHSIQSRAPSSRTHRSRTISKINALAQIGRISKAARLADALERSEGIDSVLVGSEGTHITAEQATSALTDLFPMASSLDELGEREFDEWDTERQMQVTAGEVASTITSLSIDRASGFSGWSNRLLKQLYLGSNLTDQQLITENYARFFNVMLKGQTSSHIRGYLTNVRLCLIPKSSDPREPTYRPIGVGETIFRLLGRTVLNKIGKEIGDKLAPHQLAVGIPGGVEIAASLAGLLEAINDSQPAGDTPFAMMSIDIKNAFNSIRRSYVLQGLRQHCPSLIPFFSIVYGQAVNLRWNNGSIIGTASTGVIQGDPLSTLYFALAIQPLLLDLQASINQIQTDSNLPPYARPGIVVAIADDITILARTETLFQLSTLMPSLIESYDLPLNQSKTWIMGPQANLLDDPVTVPCRSMREGGKILGAPVGNIHFILEWLHEHFRDTGPPLRTLSQLPPRAALTLIKSSYNSRMDYLRKTSTEAVVNTGIFAEYDTAIDNAILATGIADSRERLHASRTLPIDKGGLGMPLLEGHHGRRHHLVTAMRTREFLKSHHSHFIYDHTTTFNGADIDIEGTPPDEFADILYEVRAKLPTEDPLHVFRLALRKRSNETDSESSSTFHQQLLVDNDNAAAAMFLSLQGVKLTFAIYSYGHRSIPETRLSDKEYVEAMRCFFLAPFRMNIEGASRCRCRRENPWDLLTHPFHSSCCPLNSRERTFRHTAVSALLCKLLRRASPTARVTSEPRNPSAAHHPDIAIEDNALLFHVDVSIVEPTSMHALSENVAAYTTKGAAAASKEAEKIALYATTDWANVIPFVLESTGHLGKAAEDLLEKTTVEKRYLRTWFLEELSLLLARSQGRMRMHSHALLR